MRTNTRRYRFRATPKVIDLGLTLPDVTSMALQSEPHNYRQQVDPKQDLARCGATAEEQAFLVGSPGVETRRQENCTGLANGSS